MLEIKLKDAFITVVNKVKIIRAVTSFEVLETSHLVFAEFGSYPESHFDQSLLSNKLKITRKF